MIFPKITIQRLNLADLNMSFDAVENYFAEQDANVVLASPDGESGFPEFRALATDDLPDDAVTNAKLRNSGPLSVIGRSANSTGDPADISASAASGAVLRESGSTLGFGTVATAGIANDAVTDAKLRNSSALSVIGRSANSAGDPADISASADGQVLRRAAGVLGFGAVDLDDSDAVTGTLGLANGGTNADLSATGGSNQIVKQTSVGGAFTVATQAMAEHSDFTDWTNVAYNAGHYTASAGTWTVDSGDQAERVYMKIGKLMIYHFWLVGTATGVGMGPYLYIATPLSLSTNGQGHTFSVGRATIGGTAEFILMSGQYGNNKIALERVGAANWTDSVAVDIEGTIVVGLA